ncbi:GAK8 protein, partial [Zapornia atra]|nr:GAK8 protein [Zapornia atra]
GIDIKRDLPGLVAWGYAKGLFGNPHMIHELAEWKKLGDALYDAVLDDDKTAKKLAKIWREVHNSLLQQIAEKKAAEQALEAHKRNLQYGREDDPQAPSVQQVMMPCMPPVGGLLDSFVPSAPPADGSSAEEDKEKLDAPEEKRKGDREHLPASSPLQVAIPDSVPGAVSDLLDEIAKQRREAWAAVAREGVTSGDEAMIEAAGSLAFPVTYTPVYNQQGQHIQNQATFTPLDWKLLSQLRSTVSQFGFKSEPVKQMLDYIFNTNLLLPNDLRGIVKLVFTQHQQLLFNAHWQALVHESVAIQRQAGDPLYGVTIEELMGLGAYLRTDPQMLMGPDKVREAMRLVREAMDKVRDPSGIPAYMGIKQGRGESFGSFIDKAAAAIERAGVPEYMKGPMLKQCALQNANENTKRILATLGANWTIADALERMAQQPTGDQVFLINAIKELGIGLQKSAETTHTQVMAALAPLRAPGNTATSDGKRYPPGIKCYRCGKPGHKRGDCRAPGVWCQNCQSDTHNTSACKRQPGNSRRSATGRAPTQIAVATATPAASNPPLQGALDSTWQQQ